MDWRGLETLVKNSSAGWHGNGEPYFVSAVSPAMRAVEQVITNVAAMDFPVLLVGESGTGKEAVAVYLHRQSRHSEGPFVKVACGALTPEAFESLRSEFEGQNGAARAGTLFLDEITELAPTCQAALLHAVPDGEVMAHGQCLSARLVSATAYSPGKLDEALQSGILRKDLFYRLNGVYLRLPPLRERREDIPALVEFFLRRSATTLGRPLPVLNPRALDALRDYSWPGNIRELENVVKRIVALGQESVVSALGPLVPSSQRSNGDAEKFSLKETARAASRQAEKELILKVLDQTHWNRKRAARQLQISYKALLYKLRQMGLDGAGT